MPIKGDICAPLICLFANNNVPTMPFSLFRARSFEGNGSSLYES